MEQHTSEDHDFPVLDEHAGEHFMVLLLVPSQECSDRLALTLADRLESGDIRLQVVSEEPHGAINQARQRFGGIPLGFVAEDEVQALEALSNGADEVLVWPPRSDATVQGFFDRTKLRASLRKGEEQRSAAVAHSEKLAALGTLVAGVAHEINNPLTVLRFGLEAASTLVAPLTTMAQQVRVWAARGWGASPEQIRTLHEKAQTGARPHEDEQLIDEMMEATMSIANIVADLRIFSRSESDREDVQLVDLSDVIDQALRLVGRQISTVARIERDYARDLPQVLVPQGRLTQVLINLLVNAAHAIDEVQRPVHRVRIVTRSDGETVAISVSDSGPGIPPQTLTRIFDPFFTTKRAGQGTGLGLSISRSIMHDLGGDLIVESVHGSGATFIMLVPIPDRKSIRTALSRVGTVPAMRAVRPERQTVLLVDDDSHVLSAYARALGRTCDVLMAGDGREAIELLSSGSHADALVTELALPDADGKELYEWVQRERPELAKRTVFITAEATIERYPFVRELPNRVLLKPATANELLTALNEVAKPDVSKAGPRKLDT